MNYGAYVFLQSSCKSFERRRLAHAKTAQALDVSAAFPEGLGDLRQTMDPDEIRKTSGTPTDTSQKDEYTGPP